MVRTEAPVSAPATTRVSFFDNARFATVTLVVIGHGIQRLTYDSDAALTLYLWIYAFHMPAFALISGYFSKATPPDADRMKRLLTDVLLPCFIMETIWTLVQFAVEGKANFDPTRPSWTLWFLLALGIFRLVLPYLALFRWPLALAVVLSVGVGYLQHVDNTFSLSRAIGILPFFVLGWKLREWGLGERWLAIGERAWAWRAAAVAVLAAWLVVAFVNIDLFRTIDLRFWFFYDEHYAGLGEDQWWAGFVRLGLICLAVLLCAAFFVLVPRRRTSFTELGEATMYVYLLHSFVLYPLRESGVLLGDLQSALWLPVMVVACVIIAVLLATRPVQRVFRPIIQPRPRWLFRDAGDAT